MNMTKKEKRCVICFNEDISTTKQVMIDGEVVAELPVCSDHENMAAYVRHIKDDEEEEYRFMWIGIATNWYIMRSLGINSIERAIYSLTGTFSTEDAKWVDEAEKEIKRWTHEKIRRDALELLGMIKKWRNL